MINFCGHDPEMGTKKRQPKGRKVGLEGATEQAEPNKSGQALEITGATPLHMLHHEGIPKFPTWNQSIPGKVIPTGGSSSPNQKPSGFVGIWTKTEPPDVALLRPLRRLSRLFSAAVRGRAKWGYLARWSSVPGRGPNGNGFSFGFETRKQKERQAQIGGTSRMVSFWLPLQPS